MDHDDEMVGMYANISMRMYVCTCVYARIKIMMRHVPGDKMSEVTKPHISFAIASNPSLPEILLSECLPAFRGELR